MAGKIVKRVLFSIFTIAIIGTVLFYIGRSRIQEIPIEDIDKFVSVYTELSIAKETYGYNVDSTLSRYETIYKNTGVDSTWIEEFSKSLSENPELQKKIWVKIVAKLDSLRNSAPSDTVKSL